MPKTLLVFCDGTGMDGSLAPPKASVAAQNTRAVLEAPSDACAVETDGILTPTETVIAAHDRERVALESAVTIQSAEAFSLQGGGGGNTQYATNVLRLARSVKILDTKGNRQIVFYQSGVGSEANFAGDPVTGTTVLQALGTAVASKIRDAYVFLAQNYETGDDICLFGFSRGAFTARKLAGLIDRIGLLTTRNLGHFFEIWRQLTNKQNPTIPSDTRRVPIKCVGVWDTVGSVYHEINALNITDTNLPKTVQNAFHAVSLQENRKKFLPTLWTVPFSGLADGQVFKQVWFPGAHSDVGGGYERHELADISLFWMAGEVENLITLDKDLLRSYSQVRPEAWGTSQPHNSYYETNWKVKPIVGHETRLESGQIIAQSVFHESLRFSPVQLKHPDYMTTMIIIQMRFGTGFRPQYPVLNTFEKYCKDHWGSGLAAAPGGIDSPLGLMHPEWTHAVDGFTPLAAIVGGRSGADPIYVARAPYKGGIHPGKLHGPTVYIGYGNKEYTFSLWDSGVELIVGPETSVRWASVTGKFSVSLLNGATPVPGGKDADGTIYYVVQVPMHGGVHCGKVWVGDTATIPYGGKEEKSNGYGVLVYA